jgi:hypothetical protein
MSGCITNGSYSTRHLRNLPQRIKDQTIENELVEIVWSVLDSAEQGHLSVTVSLPSGDGQLHMGDNADNADKARRTYYCVSQEDILTRLKVIFPDSIITVVDTHVCIDWTV